MRIEGTVFNHKLLGTSCKLSLMKVFIKVLMKLSLTEVTMFQWWMSRYSTCMTLQINSSDHQKPRWLFLFPIKATGWEKLEDSPVPNAESQRLPTQSLPMALSQKEIKIPMITMVYNVLSGPCPALTLCSSPPTTLSSLALLKLAALLPRTLPTARNSLPPGLLMDASLILSSPQGHVLQGLLWSPTLCDLLASLPLHIMLFICSANFVSHSKVSLLRAGPVSSRLYSQCQKQQLTQRRPLTLVGQSS